MPTLKQKKVAKKLVEALQSDESVTAGEILENIGYSPSIVKNPQMIINSEGVREELANLGFSVEEADKTVANILHSGQEHNRLKAADMIYERFGAKAAQKSVHLNVNADAKDIANPKATEVTEEYHEKLRKTFEQ